MSYSTSLLNTIQTLVSDAFASATAAQNALAGHNDLYHLQMAIHEYGEALVVQETAKVLQERYKYTYAEASVDAGNRVRVGLELAAGVNTFKTVRDNLNGQ